MSDELLNIYLGHATRLLELANLYSEAATNPSRFYFPFLANTSKDAEAMASSLHAASSCTEGYAAYCSVNTDCKSDELTLPASLKAACSRIFELLSPGEGRPLVG